MRAPREPNRAAPRAVARLVRGVILVASLAASAVACGREHRREERATETAREATRPSLPAALGEAVTGAEARALSSLPAGPGRDLVVARCAICHSLALVTQQRKTPAGWAKTIDQMRAWGTPLRPDEQAALLGYLEASFGAPDPPAPGAAP